MKNCLVVLSLFVTVASAFASDSMQLSMENAISAFSSAQYGPLRVEEKASPVRLLVLQQKADLLSEGYLDSGDTTAVVLGGSCGVAGCGYIFLVTTLYSQRQVNAQTRVIAGIVQANRAGAKIVRLVDPSRI